ncbi:MAG: ATP-binding protein [Anaerolineales bacterium]|nr:ATP-binding protein [Anaerolineales bacterium]
MPFFDQIFTLLANAPGNLVYHLVLAFSITGALQSAISQLRATGYPQVRRMVLGLSLLLFGQAVLFIASGLAWQGVFNAGHFLPSLDRAVLLFGFLWILWMWALPEPARAWDATTTVVSLLILTGLVFGIVSQASLAADGGFNLSAQSLVWNIATLALLGLGIILLLVRRPLGFGNGLAMLLLASLGLLLDILWPRGGDYSGVLRLFVMAAYPLLLTLPNRFPTPANGAKNQTVAVFQKNTAESAATDRPSQSLRERRRYSTDPKTLNSLLSLAAEVDTGKINQHIVRAVAQALLADLCFLIFIGDDKNTLFIASGYDLIREENLDGGLMNKDSVPMLANAVLRGRPLRLPASTTSSDLKGLGDMLGLSNPGNLLNVPITNDQGTMGSVLLLSPYSNRLWNADDQTFLSNIAASFVPIVERGRRIGEIERQRDLARQNAEETLGQIANFQTRDAELTQQMETLKEQMAHGSGKQQEYQAVVEALEAVRVENEKLKSHLASAKSDGAGENEYYESELKLTLGEVARLQNQLAEANIKLLELEKQPSGKLSTDQAEVIASIAQELRQPMSSIIGYTDLMLGESVGILGALQRKFVERVKASTERIGSLIDDLIQITTLETGLMTLKPETVDLNLIIDNAMAYTSSQLREKNISLRIDLPEAMQPIQADREAIQQILIHLLQNAGAASTVEGSVTLRVRTEREKEQDYVLLQIADTGGGIPAEDMDRVFSRLYRADNALIQGVGDTGVGLSIARSLTEAQGGRIWVETEMGNGSTFSVLLPIHPSPVEAQS